MTAAPALNMQSITKTFPGVRALSEAKLSVESGQVMALMGANGAGKSTLMNVLGGVIIADSGQIEVGGKSVQLRNAGDASEAGIAFVHQELTMFGSMSVVENMFIDASPRFIGIGTTARMREQAAELLHRVGSDVDLDLPVEQLGTGEQQLIEIARALRDGPRIIILDEPTSSLSERERKRLFTVIRNLRDAGTAVIFITHFIDEIFETCDRLTVMRDGQTVAQTDIAEVNSTEVVRLMLGQTGDQGRIREHGQPIGAPVLEINRLCRAGAVRDASFTMYEGEVLGVWGLLGSGRTELVRALVGLDPIDSGALIWCENGRTEVVTPTILRDRIGLVTEDRRGEGIIAPHSIEENIGLPNLRAMSNQIGMIDRSRIVALTTKTIKQLAIKASGPDQKIGTLSGGNQQKVVLGRWLEAHPKVFILDEPTRGLDVKAKTDILKLVADLAKQGCAVLIVSSELEELMRICDRFLVISRGQIAQELPGTASDNELMKAVG